MKMLLPWHWNPSPTFILNSCHGAWGALITLALLLFVGHWWIAPVALAGFFVKEMFVDTDVETTTAWLEFLDFCWYLLGGVLGLGLYLLYVVTHGA